MKIRKAVLFVFAVTLLTSNIFAQGAYVNINAGYGFSMSPQVLLYNSKSNSTGGEILTTNAEVVTASLGKGFNFGGTFGYMFNKNIGAELGISYLLGSTTKAISEYTNKIIEPDGTTIINTGKGTYTLSSTMFRFMPSVIISSGFEGIDPYAKFGFIIGIGSVISDYKQEESSLTWKYNGGVALGLTAAIGTNFPVNDKLAFFGEINMVNMSYAPTKGITTEAIINGNDISEQEIEFVDNITYYHDNPPPDSEQNQQLKTRYPFGSVGISIGLRMNI